MRKFVVFMTAVFAGLFILQSCEEKKIDFEKLPGTAQAFITQYFPSAEVVFAEKEKDDGMTGYSVNLSDGTELDFDSDGNWTSIDCGFSILPDGILPQSIYDYITTNYPQYKPYKAEKEYGGYEVGITGGLELIFNANGEFVRESR